MEKKSDIDVGVTSHHISSAKYPLNMVRHQIWWELTTSFLSSVVSASFGKNLPR